jgi:hypothetical protein
MSTLYADKKLKRKAIIISLIGTVFVVMWSLFLKHDIILFYNVEGIMMELIGFFLVLIASRKLILKSGSYSGDRYVDPLTEKPPPVIEGPPDPKFWSVGVRLIIVGLAFQLFGLVITESIPRESIEMLNDDLEGISSFFSNIIK